MKDENGLIDIQCHCGCLLCCLVCCPDGSPSGGEREGLILTSKSGVNIDKE